MGKGVGVDVGGDAHQRVGEAVGRPVGGPDAEQVQAVARRVSEHRVSLVFHLRKDVEFLRF